MDNNKLLSIAEVAESANLKESFVRKLIFERRLPYLKLGQSRNGLIRVRQSDLDAWLEENLQPARKLA